MKTIRLLFISFSVVFFSLIIATAQPNDNCVNAIFLTPSLGCLPASGSTIGASQSTPPGNCGGFMSSQSFDVWYQFTAVFAENIITVEGASNMDAVLDVRSGSCDGISLGCSDATPGDGIETLTLNNLIVGQTYLIRVYDFFSSGGDFAICVTHIDCSSGDTQPPNITCPANVTLNSSPPSACSAIATYGSISASDNCTAPSINLQSGLASGSDFPAGINVVVFRATDVAGNSSTCSFTVTVNDVIPPTITCPANVTVTDSPPGSCSAIATYGSIGATDNCIAPSINLQSGLPSGSVFPLGVNVVVYRASDAASNTSTCSFTVTVEGLPCGWSQQPNGIACPGGNSIAYNTTPDVFTATSTNCYYGNPFNADAMAFAQRTLCGNGSITAQVTGIMGNAFGWAGVTIRESNATGARKVQLSTNLNSNLHRREVRSVTNGPAQPQQFPSQNRFWLKLERNGSQFTAYSSHNGIQWFPVMATNVPMNQCVEMGLVLSNYNQNSTVTATFANVSYTGSNIALRPENPAIVHLSEELIMPDILVFPNPTAGEIYMNLTHYEGKNVDIELYNINGHLLSYFEKQEVTSGQTERLDLSEYAAGIYLIRVKSQGLPDVTKRVVVQTHDIRH